MRLSDDFIEDNIYTHNFADEATWSKDENGNPDSRWKLDPEEGKAIILTACEVKANEQIKFHSPLLIEFFIDNNPNPVEIVKYESMIDWIKRADKLPEKQQYQTPGLSQPVILFVIEFPRPIILWHSGGIGSDGKPRLDDEGNIMLSEMHIRIEDNQPYKLADGSKAEVAICKYFAEIYNEVSE